MCNYFKDDITGVIDDSDVLHLVYVSTDSGADQNSVDLSVCECIIVLKDGSIQSLKRKV